MPPAKKNLTRKQAGMQATYFCPGCHAHERGLPHGVHCKEIGGRPLKRPAAAPAGAWDDLDEGEAT